MASGTHSRRRKVVAASAQEAIVSELISRLGRDWKVGDRLPPVKELAIELGAGESNTYLAVRQLAGEGVLDCRQRRGTYVLKLPGSRHDVQTSQALSHKSPFKGKQIALFKIAPTVEGFIQRVIDAFHEVFEGLGATLEEHLIPEIRGEFEYAQADAVVLVQPGPYATFKPARGQYLLIIPMNSQHEVISSPLVDVVAIDEHHGGVLAGQAFRRMIEESGGGVNDLTPCFLGKEIERKALRFDAVSTTRLHGFEAGLDRLINPDHLIRTIGYSPESGGKAFRQYIKLPDRPKHIFAASDDLALGFIAAAAGNGLKAGQDYHIIGFDGQVRGQKLEEGPMTTIQVPTTEIGKRAGQLLIERFHHPSRPNHRLLLDCTFHQGVTTATINGVLP